MSVTGCCISALASSDSFLPKSANLLFLVPQFEAVHISLFLLGVWWRENPTSPVTQLLPDSFDPIVKVYYDS